MRTREIMLGGRSTLDPGDQQAAHVFLTSFDSFRGAIYNRTPGKVFDITSTPAVPLHIAGNPYCLQDMIHKPAKRGKTGLEA